MSDVKVYRLLDVITGKPTDTQRILIQYGPTKAFHLAQIEIRDAELKALVDAVKEGHFDDAA